MMKPDGMQQSLGMVHNTAVQNIYTLKIIQMADEDENTALSPGLLLNEKRVLRIPLSRRQP